MRPYLVILKSEIFALFISPSTYVATFYFLSLLGFGFRFFLESFSFTDWILPPLSSLVIGLLFGSPALIPFITMRSFAEERRLGTLETLMSAPIESFVLVLGKWSACYLFFLIITCLSFCYPLLVLIIFPEQGINLGFDKIEYWTGGGLFIILYGGSFTSIGIFASSVTKNQMVAGMLTFTLLTIYISLMAFSFGETTHESYNHIYNIIEIGLGNLGNGLKKLEQFSVGLIDIATFFNQSVLIIFFLVLTTIQVNRLNR